MEKPDEDAVPGQHRDSLWRERAEGLDAFQFLTQALQFFTTFPTLMDQPRQLIDNFARR